MAGDSIKIDTSDFDKHIKELLPKLDAQNLKALSDMGLELLRLSQFEVPIDVGTLANTGHVEPPKNDEVVVGYHTKYAARLHEHPEYHFQRGRKGKYLIDPAKNNLTVFRNYYASIIGEIFK